MTNTPARQQTDQQGLADLPRIVLPADTARFINFLAGCRNAPDEWRIFYATIGADSKSKADEAIQYFSHALQDREYHILRIAGKEDLVVVTTLRGKKSFVTLENDVIQTMESQGVRLLSTSLNDKGVDQLAKVFSTLLPQEDTPVRMALRRFSRLSNVFMVLDDDPVVLRQMDHMLKSYGHVETHATVKDFLSAYNKYAPNMAFLDIHLQGDKGTNVSGMIMEKVDPGAHVVMISADAVKENVLESKYKGAKGFIGKPVNMEMVLRHILSSPTMYQKK